MNRSKLEQQLEAIHFFGCLTLFIAGIGYIIYMFLYQPISTIPPAAAIDTTLITHEHCIKHCEQYE